jgi:hypothetical protein
MRVSSDPFDAGYANWRQMGQRTRVFLDGIERNGVMVADEEERMIVMVKRGEDGNILLSTNGKVLTETLYGAVRVEPGDE